MTDTLSQTEREQELLTVQIALVNVAVNSAFLLDPLMRPVADGMLAVLMAQGRERGPQIMFDGFAATVSYQDGGAPLVIDCHPVPSTTKN